MPSPSKYAAGLILLICYGRTLAGMAAQWANDEDMGHGFAVPFAIGWVIWNERERWMKVPVIPSLWGGIPLLAAGAALHAAGTLGGGLFVSAVALLVSLCGAVVALAGWSLLRAWTFPLLLTLFMLPKLAIVYNQVTLPLQLLASKLAAGMLTSLGIGVLREGNILDVGGHRVAVAEACNGIRFLLPLAFSGVMLFYATGSSPIMRGAALLASVPLSIFANALRVALSAWIPMLDSGTPHQVAGYLVFALGLAMLFMLHWALNSVRRHAD